MLRKQIKETLVRLSAKFENTKLVWSQILPRFKWRSETDPKQLNNVRVRINRAVANHLIANKGAYVKYPELSIENEGFFKDDGVHLTDLGNDLLLFRLQEALQIFLTTNAFVYPSREVCGCGEY